MTMTDTTLAESGTRLQNFLDRAGLRGFPWKTATILYTISWGWLFIVRDSYWIDDWTVFNFGDAKNNRVIYGLAPWTVSIKAIFDAFGPGVMRVIIFMAYFFSGVLVFGISRKFLSSQVQDRKFITLFFLLLPFNSARVALTVFLYTSAYLLFFLAWYIYINASNKSWRLLAYSLFFFSFQMHSILAFCLVPIMHSFYICRPTSLEEVLIWIKKNWLMFFLPVIYWISRAEFWPERVNYHSVSISKAFDAVGFVLISGCLFVLVIVLSFRSHSNKASYRIVGAGLASISLGVFPYVINGFFPSDLAFIVKYLETFVGRSDWYSRHQTLQPLGVALLIVGVIELLPKFLEKLTKQFQASILAVCVVLSVGFGNEYVVDHAKQKEIVRVLKEHDENKSGSSYQFVDQTTPLNARGRKYRERDWKGLIWLAYGVESMRSSRVATKCDPNGDVRLVLIRGPETHWEALKNWVSDGDMGFKVTVDDRPGACKPEMVTSEKVSGAIPILFYFTGAKD